MEFSGPEVGLGGSCRRPLRSGRGVYPAGTVTTDAPAQAGRFFVPRRIFSANIRRKMRLALTLLSDRCKSMLMETLSRWIGGVNDVLWTYVLVAALLGCAVWFTPGARGRAVPPAGRDDARAGRVGRKRPEGASGTSRRFQAFAVSLASRVGTGNLAGIATAIVVGGPGAVFWMWVIALVGAASAFVESTLAQLYKRRGRDSFIGGPAYYMERGLGRRWMGVLFAVLISVTFGFAFNSVQSNTICAAWEGAGADHVWVGVVLTALTLLSSSAAYGALRVSRRDRPDYGAGVHQCWRWASCCSTSGGCPKCWN